MTSNNEQALETILNAYELPLYEINTVFAPKARHLRPIYEALRQKATRFWDIPVSQEGLERLQRKLEDCPDDARPVAWLQQPDYHPDGWRAILPNLNLHRSTMGKRVPLMLVLAGPRALEPVIRDYPDLKSVAVVAWLDDEAPKPPPRETLRWLHLSDFHFRAKESWDSRLPLQALLTKIEALCNEGLAPHFVCLTGDIASRGLDAEYDEAIIFLQKLARLLEMNPTTHWFMVPGNHDVDRSKITKMNSILLNSAVDDLSLRELLDDPDSAAMIAKRMDAYYRFHRELLGGGRMLTPQQPSRADLLQVNGWKLGVMQINLSWSCAGGQDKGSLLFGRQNLLDMREILAGTDMRFALTHQPLSYLPDWEAEKLEPLLNEAAGPHFLLRGHLHQNDGKRILSPQGEQGYFEFATGAVLTRDPHYCGFAMGELDPNGKGRVRFYRYSAVGSGFWAETRSFIKTPRMGSGVLITKPKRQRPQKPRRSGRAFCKTVTVRPSWVTTVRCTSLVWPKVRYGPRPVYGTCLYHHG